MSGISKIIITNRSACSINELVRWCTEKKEDGIYFTTYFPELSYEDGIVAAIKWLSDKEAIYPIDIE